MKNEKGFTLIELLIVTFALVFSVGVLFVAGKLLYKFITW